MPQTDDDGAPADGPIPSGPWRGFYVYGAGSGRHRMDLRLDFKEGVVRGDGIDDVGRFWIRGDYDPETLHCRWTKSYVGGHDVLYAGPYDMNSIYGVWTIPPFARGGFRIWPLGLGETLYLVIDEEVPVEGPV